MCKLHVKCNIMLTVAGGSLMHQPLLPQKREIKGLVKCLLGLCPRRVFFRRALIRIIRGLHTLGRLQVSAMIAQRFSIPH